MHLTYELNTMLNVELPLMTIDSNSINAAVRMLAKACYSYYVAAILSALLIASITE